MANAGNAYATVNPIKTNIGDVVQGIEQMDFAYREEQRKIDAIKQAQKDKEALELEKKRAKFKPINIDSTGVKSIDEVNAQTLLKAVNMYGELDKKLAQAKTPEEQAAITIQLQKLQSLPDYLKLAQDAFVSQAKDIQTKMDKGEIKQTPELLSKLQSFSQGYLDVELDDNMTPMIGLWDKDGDGKPDVLPYDKIISGQTFGELIPNVDFSGNFMEVGTKVGTVKEQTDQNFVKNTKLYTPDELNKTAAKAELYLENGQLSPVAKSYLYDKGVRDFQNVPDELLNKMEQDAVNIMETVQKKEDITDKDYTAETGRISENRQGKPKEEKASIGNPVVPSKNTWGDQYERISATESLSVPIIGKVQLPAISIKTGTKGGKPIYANVTDATLENYTYNKDGKLVIDVSYGIDKTTSVSEGDTGKQTTVSKEKRKKQIIASPETEARIASKLGVSVQELREAAGYSGKLKETAAQRIERLKKERGLK